MVRLAHPGQRVRCRRDGARPESFAHPKKIHGRGRGKSSVLVVSDAIDFLRARGHDTNEMSDYEIAETFTAAFKNWQHDLVEAAFYSRLPLVSKPRDRKK